jgi:hypothetical protein
VFTGRSDRPVAEWGLVNGVVDDDVEGAGAGLASFASKSPLAMANAKDDDLAWDDNCSVAAGLLRTGTELYTA